MTEFVREKHVYNSPEFDELIKDTIRFFNGTPVHTLPPPERFTGPGVYALYYIGQHDLYTPLYEKNRTSFDMPIYVGKAVLTGWRQGRVTENGAAEPKLYQRLREHSRNIVVAENLNVEDFRCRFMILEDLATNMIGTVEAALIRFYTPLWNIAVDGFGNHTPGAGRFNQAKSDWDVIHPGRGWAEKCKGKHKTEDEIIANISGYFKEMDKK